MGGWEKPSVSISRAVRPPAFSRSRQELGKACDSKPYDAGDWGEFIGGQSDLDLTRRSGRGVTDGREPDLPNQLSNFRGVGFGRTGSNSPVHPGQNRGFHTDSIQNAGSGPHILRHPGQPRNAPMLMKSQKAAQSAGLLAASPMLALRE